MIIGLKLLQKKLTRQAHALSDKEEVPNSSEDIGEVAKTEVIEATVKKAIE